MKQINGSLLDRVPGAIPEAISLDNTYIVIERFVSPLLDAFYWPVSKQLCQYEWTFLLLVQALTTLVLCKISYCFQQFRKQGASKSVTASIPEKEQLKDLFSGLINYEQFRDQVLTYRTHTKLSFNNYNLSSFRQLSPSASILVEEKIENCHDKKSKNLQAGVANYEAIVDLYVRRFLSLNPEMNKEPYLSALRFTALCIAIKISYDQAVWNSDLQQFLQIQMNVAIHKKMELAFLKAIDWNLSVKEICLQNSNLIENQPFVMS